MRLKKKQRSESGSNNSDCSQRRSSMINISRLTKSESFSGSILTEETLSSGVLTEETSSTTLLMSTSQQSSQISTVTDMESEEDALPKPNFQLGAYTSKTFFTRSSSTLGALATLGYDQDATPVREPSYTGTEDNSNQSEQQAWDDYQEKYMSEAYSEGRDSDTARKLLEFGDDYRNFLDSQSDCCSSLSAANNLDSMSPPRHRKLLPQFMVQGQHGHSKSPSDDDNTMKRRLDVERRRRHLAESSKRFGIEGTCHFAILIAVERDYAPVDQLDAPCNFRGKIAEVHHN